MTLQALLAIRSRDASRQCWSCHQLLFWYEVRAVAADGSGSNVGAGQAKRLKVSA